MFLPLIFRTPSYNWIPTFVAVTSKESDGALLWKQQSRQ